MLSKSLFSFPENLIIQSISVMHIDFRAIGDYGIHYPFSKSGKLTRIFTPFIKLADEIRYCNRSQSPIAMPKSTI